MTWTRLDDNWQADPAFDGLDANARYHYLMMIQFCSRGRRYDGVMPLIEAEMCSVADDKPGVIAKLIDRKLVEQLGDGRLRLPRIDEHVPPPSVREAAAATRERVARHRKHKNGDHSDCLPGKCGNASRNALHQDGDSDRQGLAVTGSTAGDSHDEFMTAEQIELERLEARRAAGDAA